MIQWINVGHRGSGSYYSLLGFTWEDNWTWDWNINIGNPIECYHLYYRDNGIFAFALKYFLLPTLMMLIVYDIIQINQTFVDRSLKLYPTSWTVKPDLRAWPPASLLVDIEIQPFPSQNLMCHGVVFCAYQVASPCSVTKAFAKMVFIFSPPSGIIIKTKITFLILW